jgi:hypothetical protein
MAHRLATGPEAGYIGAQGHASRVWFGYAASMLLLPAGSAAPTSLTNQGFASTHAFYLASEGLEARLAAESVAYVDGANRRWPTPCCSRAS